MYLIILIILIYVISNFDNIKKTKWKPDWKLFISIVIISIILGILVFLLDPYGNIALFGILFLLFVPLIIGFIKVIKSKKKFMLFTFFFWTIFYFILIGTICIGTSIFIEFLKYGDI